MNGRIPLLWKMANELQTEFDAMDTEVSYDTEKGIERMLQGGECSNMKKLTFYEKDVWNIFVKPGEIVEVRIPKAYGKSQAWEGFAKGAVSGYFDDHEAFGNAVKAADKASNKGIYFTLQVIDTRLIGRAFNRLKPADVTTSDQNVIAYRWLPIDIDPVRPSGINSSDSELKAALNLRNQVAKYVISEHGFSAPIKAMSGNGGHLLFRLPDLPINDGRYFIYNTLVGLAKEFDTDKVTIDTTVCNPSRIWKLYGTTARKGDAVPAGPGREARPHRMAYIDDLGGQNG